MSASLVGSEMCIRDRTSKARGCGGGQLRRTGHSCCSSEPEGRGRRGETACLLYTSDAADDM
eukprot:9265095-Alexandrium_andersonii.AAC.1